MKTLKLFLATAFLFSILGASRYSGEETKLFHGTENVLFEEFVNEFQHIKLPYKITLEDLKTELNANNSMILTNDEKPNGGFVFSRKYRDILPDLRHAMFSRMGPNEIEPMVAFSTVDDMIGVVYSSKRPFGFDKSYKMALFDKKGKFENNYLLAHANLNEMITCEINDELIVTQNVFNSIWSEDVHVNGYTASEVERFENIDTKYFQIKNGGKLVPLKEYPTTAKASLY